MILVLTFLLIFGTSFPDADFLGGDNVILSEPEARAAFAAETGAPLPPGAEISGYLEGGFQDKYVQIRIEASYAAFSQITGPLGMRYATQRAGDLPPISEVDWWQPYALIDARVSPGHYGRFPNVTILAGLSPQRDDLWILYILASET